jgi:23S rRNA pseudouridine1911/1915/1917 synthase
MGEFQGPVDERASSGLRLDRYVAECLGILSRSQVKSRALTARLNGREVKISRPVKPGDFLELRWEEAESTTVEPQDLPLDILYEDSRAVVINKAQGMVVHPGAGNRQGTVANALLFRRLNRGLSAQGPRPGIVHRLDKDTSGVLIAAYDDEALAFLADQFKNRSTKKLYIAVVQGNLKEKKGRIETLISRDPRDRKKFVCSTTRGKMAITLYRVVKQWPGYSLLMLSLKTGRTHQLRVHLRHLGYPILGDPIYGKPDRRFPQATLMLHAYRLTLILPQALGPSSFKAPVPQRFRDIFKSLSPL